MTLAHRVRLNLEVVLEEVCRDLPNGGDHDVRKMVAERLLKAAEAGQHSLGELRAVDLRAFEKASTWPRRSAQ